MIADALQKLKIVDDVVPYNPTICKVLFCVFDYLHLCGQNDINLNPKKFKFCQKEIDFAGYNIAWDGYHTTDNMSRLSLLAWRFPRQIHYY